MSATSQGTLECPTVRGSDTSLILLGLPNFCPLFGFNTT